MYLLLSNSELLSMELNGVDEAIYFTHIGKSVAFDIFLLSSSASNYCNIRLDTPQFEVFKYALLVLCLTNYLVHHSHAWIRRENVISHYWRYRQHSVILLLTTVIQFALYNNMFIIHFICFKREENLMRLQCAKKAYNS